MHAGPRKRDVPVLHGARGKVGDGHQVHLGQRVRLAKVVGEEGQGLGGDVEGKLALAAQSRRRVDTDLGEKKNVPGYVQERCQSRHLIPMQGRAAPPHAP